MTSSYAVPAPSSSSSAYYDSDVSSGYTGYDYPDYYDDGAIDKATSHALGWGISGAIVLAIIAIVVIGIIIAVCVEVKALNNAVTVVKDRGMGGWLQSVADSFNEVDSERVLKRMFPGGFSQVVQSIETAYRRYRGLDKERVARKVAKTVKAAKKSKQ